MRNPADIPSRARKPSRFSDRGRALLIIAAVLLVGLLLSARFISSFYVEYLWHQSVGRTDVFWGVLGAKFTMFALFAGTFIVLALLNLIIADRLAPTSFSANTHPLVERFHEFFGHRMRLFRFGVAVIFGLLFAAPAIGRWQDWLMFRNSKSFGIADRFFGNDVGFYMFRLPFITFVLDWLFLAVLFITLLVVATHVLSGGILIQPPKPKVRTATKAHVAVLLALLAVLKAGDYWVTRYELTTANRGAVRGVTYAVENAQLPAVLLLALVALLTAGLYLSTLKTQRWRPAVVASGLWAIVALVGGVIYPSAMQSLVVAPNQKDKEAKYIAYNIEATQHALGIDGVTVAPVEFGDLTSTDLTNNVAALQDVRLLKPTAELETRFQADQPRPNTKVIDVDPDRYEVDGTIRQVIVGARELDLANVGNKSWQGTHLINTHGCGLIVSPAGQITASRKPAYDDTIAKVDRPELYFDSSSSGYAILNTSVTEQPCDGQEVAPYEGSGGVLLDSTLRKLAFALDEWDYNLIGTSSITDKSRLISVRNVSERVAAVAPFLSLDGDPYPVAVDGRIVWVIDAYTTSNRYPFGEGADLKQLEPGSGLDLPLNYVRNSVKAVVDAYDGSVKLYEMDATDPILKVWESAFPDLFLPLSEMPTELRNHLRYPEELFRIQTAAYSKYRLPASQFFERNGAWSVAQAAPEQTKNLLDAAGTVVTEETVATETVVSEQFASDSNSPRFEPYYTMFHPAGDGEASFQLYRPFQPFSPADEFKNLVAYMTASSDPATYGQMVAYTLPASTQIDGPFNVGASMVSTPDVSAYITVNNQQGSTVLLGDLQILPVADGVLWFRPLYVESKGSGQPLTNKMIVNYKGKVAMGESFTDAVRQLFPGFRADIGDVLGSTPVDPGTDPGTDPGNEGATAQELLTQAQDLFDQADTALENRDLATYDEKVKAARALVAQALEMLDT
ncbi:MAG: UPF0182 family protein [Ilumatobacteraceae bacterium]|nr:UPF0182 family protein [Ilumatobacteraceae bacterium]